MVIALKVLLTPLVFLVFGVLILVSIPMLIVGLGLEVLDEPDAAEWCLDNCPANLFLYWANV